MFYDQFIKLCALRGVSPSAAAEAAGATRKAATGWKNGAEPRRGVKAKLAEFFNVSIAFFDGNEPLDPSLNARDRRDIAKSMGELEELLMSEEGLMFNGNPITPEQKQSLLNAMQLGVEAAKLRNKEKYTPQKYRKPQE